MKRSTPKPIPAAFIQCFIQRAILIFCAMATAVAALAAPPANDPGVDPSLPRRPRSTPRLPGPKLPAAKPSVPMPAAPDEDSTSDRGARPAPSAKAISQWITELGSDSYSLREAATDHLIQAGRSAIDAVCSATQKDDLEVTTRSVQILSALLKAPDIATADAAESALARIAAVRNASTAAMAAAGIATDALADYEQVREERVLDEIRRFGGDVQINTMIPGNPEGVQITLESTWKGGLDGLKLLKHVPNLERLAIHGVPMTDRDLVDLNSLSQLTYVELCGTKVTVAATQKFAQAHPSTQVERRNAKLGVMGDLNGTCRITVVQPGSAAERAGLMIGDVVTKFQDRAVNDFQGLRAEIGAYDAGDKVKVEITRGNDTLQKEVTLGDWK